MQFRQNTAGEALLDLFSKLRSARKVKLYVNFEHSAYQNFQHKKFEQVHSLYAALRS